MRSAVLASLAAGLWLVPAAARAQVGPGQQSPAASAGGATAQSAWFERMLDRLADELELDEAQRTRFQELARPYRRRRQELAGRWREVREAMRAGDEQRAAALRAELLRGSGPGGFMPELLDELAPILRDDQLDRLYEMQDRMEEQRRRRQMYRRLTSELPGQLALDESQRAAWERLLAEARQQRQRRWGQMRPLWDELRAAEAAGDQARAAELRERLEALRPDQQQMVSAFLTRLEQVLNQQQKDVLAQFRREFDLGQPAADRPQDVRTILRAARRVRLGSAQRSELKQIERTALRARRQLRHGDRQGHARLAAKIKERISALLDARQKREFEQQLKRLEARARRPAPAQKP